MIYIDASYYKQGITGLSRFSDELIDEILKILDGKKTILFCFKGQNNNMFLKNKVVEINVSVSLFSYITFISPRLARFILRFYFKGKGTIHYHDSIRFPGDIKGFKSIVTIHDIASLVFKDKYVFRSRLLKKSGLLRILSSEAKTIAVSKSTKLDLENFNKKFKNRVVVIGEGVNNLFLNQDLKYLKNDNEKPFFLVVGSPHKRKNFESVYKAFKSFIAKNKYSYNLIFAGRNVKIFFQDIGINDFENIIFKHGVSDNELIKLYSNAYAYLNFSIHEGFGLTILEAMARKCLVLGSNTTAVYENIGGNGITASPFSIEDIERALKDAVNLQSKEKVMLIEKAYSSLNYKKWDYIANLYANFYEK